MIMRCKKLQQSPWSNPSFDSFTNYVCEKILPNRIQSQIRILFHHHQTGLPDARLFGDTFRSDLQADDEREVLQAMQVVSGYHHGANYWLAVIFDCNSPSTQIAKYTPVCTRPDSQASSIYLIVLAQNCRGSKRPQRLLLYSSRVDSRRPNTVYALDRTMTSHTPKRVDRVSCSFIPWSYLPMISKLPRAPFTEHHSLNMRSG